MAAPSQHGTALPPVSFPEPAPRILSEPRGPYSDLRYSTRDGVATVTLARPRALNAYSTGTLEELAHALHEAARDDAVGVIVLTGIGSQAFCTGGDVKEYASRYIERPHEYWQYMNAFRRAVEALLHAGKPTIARLNGIAVGGGNELHLACDLSVAASHVYLGQVGVGVGSVAAGGATQWLPLVVGDRRARQMLFLNDRIPAAKALDWGLVNEVAPSVRRDGELLPHPSAEEIAAARAGSPGYAVDLEPLDRAVEALARRLLGMFPECLRYTKLQTNYWKERAWQETIGQAQEWLALHFATGEPLEGMSAFAEKRPARVPEIRRALAEGGTPEYPHGPPVVRCPACGAARLPRDLPFCGSCGRPLRPPEAGGRA